MAMSSQCTGTNTRHLSMNPETLTALKASIKHWEENVSIPNITEAHFGSSYCALCQRFINNAAGTCTTEDGESCPVSIKANAIGCVNTPWRDVTIASQAYIYAKNKNSDIIEYHEKNYRLCAQRELDFLRSLLPTTDIQSASTTATPGGDCPNPPILQSVDTTSMPQAAEQPSPIQNAEELR